MSQIDDLIEQYCPNGVEYKELGSLMAVSRGASPRPINKFITEDDDGVPWIKIGDVSPTDKFVRATKQKITKEGAKKSRYLAEGSFILSNSMSFGRPYILGINGCIHDGWIALENYQNDFCRDFLYYLLRSSPIQLGWKQRAGSSTVQNLNSDIVRTTLLPVPPLPVQQKIVEILDKFTALEAELEAELEARTKQYEYYRNLLFNLNDCPVFCISEIADTNIGLATSVTKHKTSSGVVLLHNSDIQQNKIILKNKEFISPEFAKKNNKKVLRLNDIITVHTGDVGTSALIDERYAGAIGFTTITTRIRDTSLIIPAYLCHYLNSQRCKQDIASMTISDRSNLNQKCFEKLSIPVPSIPVQKYIVDTLDKFSTLVTDISQGLPAEIEARHKQYEYYRDKLLTFKPLEQK